MREFVGNLFEKNKKFLIIGSKMAFTYSNLFPLFKNKLLRTGYTVPNKFLYYDKTINKVYEKNLSGMCRWFTNLDTSEKEEIQIFKKYKAENYQFVDQLNKTIHVTKLKDIPHDYKGDMAVPITILDKKYDEKLKIKDIKRGISVNGVNVFQKVIVEIIK